MYLYTEDSDGDLPVLPLVLGIMVAVLLLIIIVYVVVYHVRRRRRISLGDGRFTLFCQLLLLHNNTYSNLTYSQIT